METEIKKHSKKNSLTALLPVLAIACYSALSALNLTRAIWFDEAYTAYVARGSYIDIIKMASADVHPPFYYICLKTWSLVFGTSDVALRSMNVVFGAAGIAVAYLLFRRMFGAKIAGIAAVALGMSPMLVRYTQEMRMYSVVFLIVMCASYALYSALKSESMKMWYLYAVFVSLGMWTHYFAALLWLAELAYIVMRYRKLGIKFSDYRKTLLKVYIVAVALFIPWIPSFIEQTFAVQGGFWIPPVNTSTSLSFFTEGFVYSVSEETEGWLAVILIAAVIAVTYLFIRLLRSEEEKEKEALMFLFTVVFLPPFILMLLSLRPLQPMYMTRYVIYSVSLLWPFCAVVLCKGAKLFDLKKKAIKIIALAIALIFVAMSCVGMFRAQAEDNVEERSIRGILCEIGDDSEDGEPIIVHSDLLNYYSFFFYETEKHRVYGLDIDFKWGSLKPIEEYGTNYIDDKDAFVKDLDRFWLITDAESKKETTDISFDGFVRGREIVNGVYKAVEFVADRSPD